MSTQRRHFLMRNLQIFYRNFLIKKFSFEWINLKRNVRGKKIRFSRYYQEKLKYKRLKLFQLEEDRIPQMALSYSFACQILDQYSLSQSFLSSTLKAALSTSYLKLEFNLIFLILNFVKSVCNSFYYIYRFDHKNYFSLQFFSKRYFYILFLNLFLN